MMEVSCFAFLLPTSVEYVRELGSTKEIAGVLVGLFAYVTAVTGPPFQWVIQKFGLKVSFLLVQFFLIIGSVIYALAFAWDSLAALMIGRALQGIGGNNVGNHYIARAFGINVRSKWMVLDQNFCASKDESN